MEENLDKNLEKRGDALQRSASNIFISFCQQNNIDMVLMEESWIEFEGISRNFTLQGDTFTWLIVALFLTSKLHGEQNNKIRLDIFKILKNAKLTVSEFLMKTTKWVKMKNCESPLKNYICNLILNHSTSTRLFFRYCEKYCIVFVMPEIFCSIDTTYNKRKQRKRQVNDNELFHFIWILFICAKSLIPEFNGDPISLIHLLSCCFQYVFSSVLLNNTLKTKLLNKNFAGLPPDFENIQLTEEKIPNLSKILFAHESDAFHQSYKSVYDNNWGKFLLDISSKGLLRLTPDNLADFMDPDNFSHNLNKIDTFYKDFASTSDLIDEQQFLFSLYETEFNSFSTVQLKVVINSCKTFKKSCETPSPFPSPLKSSIKIQKNKLGRCLSKIFLNLSNFYLEIASLCAEELNVNFITQIINEFFDKIKSQQNIDSILSNLEIISGIYHKLLISIIKCEKSHNPKYCLSNLLHDYSFNLAVISCAFEIFAFLFNEDEFAFPWINNLLTVDSFNYVKIIEVVIRSETDLTRDIIKKFNQIEEMIINHNAWLQGSSLYETILNNNNIIPSVEQVKFQHRSNDRENESELKLYNLSGNTQADSTPFSAVNLFQDTTRLKKLETATRNLFSSHTDKQNSIDNTRKCFQIPEFPLIKIMTTNEFSDTVSVSYSVPPDQDIFIGSDDNSRDTQNSSGKYLTPLVFFMRKLYHLASTRLNSLCEFLKIKSDLHIRCWMCLEHIIINCYVLFENHYLDQIIICCVYAIGRSTSYNWSFNEILRWYRSQQYYNQKVYRHVMLTPVYDDNVEIIDSSNTPTYGDLITYYNKVPATNTCSPTAIFSILNTFHNKKLSTETTVYVSPKKRIPCESSIKHLYKFTGNCFTETESDQHIDTPHPYISIKRKMSPFNEEYDVGALLYCHSPLKIHKKN
ncbi:hypothetical protein HZS_1222 [Henneguya salminicola]|nr:hypothetical protein HZS_1222 [Henneguya salminicola]